MSNTERLLAHRERQIEGLADDRDNLRDERNVARQRIAQLEAENAQMRDGLAKFANSANWKYENGWIWTAGYIPATIAQAALKESEAE